MGSRPSSPPTATTASSSTPARGGSKRRRRGSGGEDSSRSRRNGRDGERQRPDHPRARARRPGARRACPRERPRRRLPHAEATGAGTSPRSHCSSGRAPAVGAHPPHPARRRSRSQCHPRAESRGERLPAPAGPPASAPGGDTRCRPCLRHEPADRRRGVEPRGHLHAGFQRGEHDGRGASVSAAPSRYECGPLRQDAEADAPDSRARHGGRAFAAHASRVRDHSGSTNSNAALPSHAVSSA